MNMSNELLAFWGGLASIIALCAMAFTGFKNVNTNRILKLEQQRKRIDQDIIEISALSESATTQGRRIDLFVYKESVLADARFMLLRREIFAGTTHIVSFLYVILVFQGPSYYMSELQPDAIANYSPAVTKFVEPYLYWYFTFTFLVVLFINLHVRRSMKKVRLRVNMISNIFIDSLEKQVSSNFDTSVDLEDKIYD